MKPLAMFLAPVIQIQWNVHCFIINKQIFQIFGNFLNHFLSFLIDEVEKKLKVPSKLMQTSKDEGVRSDAYSISCGSRGVCPFNMKGLAKRNAVHSR